MLKGTLDDFALPDVFRLVMVAKRTGKLDIVRSAGSGKVFFREGEVYYAESTVAREPLGQKLIRSGALTEGGLLKALDENASSGERVGDILLRNGSVSAEQLQAAVRDQIEDSVFDLLRWDLGEFNWEANVIADVEVPISISVENLIMESARRLDEMEVILRKIPSEDAVPAMASAPPEGAVEINITPQEWRMLVLVDGNRSIHDIAEQVGLDDFTVMRSVYGLISAGLVEIKDFVVARDSSGDVFEAVHPSQQAKSASQPESQPESEPEQAEAEDAPAASAEDETPLGDLDAEMAEILSEAQSEADQPVADEPTAEEPESDEPQAEEAEIAQEPAAAEESQPAEEPVATAPVAEDVSQTGKDSADIDLDAAIAMAQAEASDGGEAPSIYQDSFVAESLESFDAGGSPAFEPLEEGKISFESFIDEPAGSSAENDSNGSENGGSENNVFFMNSADEAEESSNEAPERSFEVLSGSDTAEDDISSVLEDDPLDVSSWEPSVVGFDAPEGDEMTTTTPGEDPFLEDLFGSQPEEPRQPPPPAPEPVRDAPAAPAAAAPDESPSVDRASVVRELAGLFSDEDRPRPRQAAPTGKPAAESEEEDLRKRVEDDDQVTKGLISRLIDGVKGL